MMLLSCTLGSPISLPKAAKAFVGTGLCHCVQIHSRLSSPAIISPNLSATRHHFPLPPAFVSVELKCAAVNGPLLCVRHSPASPATSSSLSYLVVFLHCVSHGTELKRKRDQGKQSQVYTHVHTHKHIQNPAVMLIVEFCASSSSP